MTIFSQEIKIENKIINEKSPSFFIAEAGVNHNGDLVLAKKLVDAAFEAGADAVKFQTFSTDRLIIKDTKKAKYQVSNTGNNDSQYDMLKELELSFEEHKIIKDYCDKKGIIFMSTPYDKESVEMLDDLGVPAYKVASTDNTNLPFLRYLSQRDKPVILSTGMAYLSEITQSVKVFEDNKFKDLIILHCVSNYPIEVEKTNLSVINTLRNSFKTIVGYSDHSEGIGAAPFSIPFGSKVIEKHFTLDKDMSGPDHKASLNPKELKETINLIRKVEKAVGNGIKVPILEEKDSRSKLQKSLVSKSKISKGTVIREDMLISKRPGTGISPLYINDIIGRKTKIDIEDNTILDLEMFKE
ncbi:MAG: N-acetylneuraminate synthase [bacterium]